MSEELPLCKCGCGNQVERAGKTYFADHYKNPVGAPASIASIQFEDEPILTEDLLLVEVKQDEVFGDEESPYTQAIIDEGFIPALKNNTPTGISWDGESSNIDEWIEDEWIEDEPVKESYRSHLFNALKLKTRYQNMTETPTESEILDLP